MRRINNDNLLGIRAEFALPKKKENIVEDCLEQIDTPTSIDNFENVIKMENRDIKGPFCDPPSLDSVKMQPIIGIEDYKSSLKFVNPEKDFLTDMIDKSEKTFQQDQVRIIQGRIVPM